MIKADGIAIDQDQDVVSCHFLFRLPEGQDTLEVTLRREPELDDPAARLTVGLTPAQALKLGTQIRDAAIEADPHLGAGRFVEVRGLSSLRKRAERTAKLTAAELGIDVPQLRFFRVAEYPDEPGIFYGPWPLRGWAWLNRGVIWVYYTGLLVDHLDRVVRHELGHLAGMDEDEAEAFAKGSPVGASSG